MMRRLLSLLCLGSLVCAAGTAQRPAANGFTANREDEELRFVVYISRHGVRSPTGRAPQYNVYSAAPWPTWPVEPGLLTEHGFHLMELFGAYDRERLAGEGLLGAKGCEDAARVSFYADSDERTLETGRALAQGMFPGCKVPVAGNAQGVNDPLFHTRPRPDDHETPALATAALAGRIGGSADNLTTAYKAPLAMLEDVLTGCGKGAPSAANSTKRTSIFEVPAALNTGAGDHLVDFKGPLSVAATLSENLLLEYTEGMPAEQVGWGCVDGAKLRSLMALHTASTEYGQRTLPIARAQSALLLENLHKAMAQAATGKRVDGALSRVDDRALFLVGHDTNLENIGGALHLDWILDGRADDTPPGSAMVFELWRNRASGALSVRAFFTAQTLEQMRDSVVLSPSTPPDAATLYLPGCSGADMGCTWASFDAMLKAK